MRAPQLEKKNILVNRFHRTIGVLGWLELYITVPGIFLVSCVQSFKIRGLHLLCAFPILFRAAQAPPVGLRSAVFSIFGLSIMLISCNPIPQEERESSTKYYKPWESLGPLFHDVQMTRIYSDSKTFVDCTPRRGPANIAMDYLRVKDNAGFDLADFVDKNFEGPGQRTSREPEAKQPFEEHLQNQWANLTRPVDSVNTFSTLIALPERYVVPGGRFREIYYWDSYFTMIGLGTTGREDLVKSMLDNFAYLIETAGFIPNGNRTYYLGRSQPPYFSSMVGLYMQLWPSAGLEYLVPIRKEYDFWMSGSERLSADRPAIGRVVLLEDGLVLNRYWDNLDFPRPESHREDYELARHLASDVEKQELYRNLRAGAESGWDYSTRWFADSLDFKTIRTTHILPVDLNCLLYRSEILLSSLYLEKGDTAAAKVFEGKAEVRRNAIHKYFWNEEHQFFTDFLWTESKLSDQVTLAGCYPMYFKIATEQQAQGQKKVIEQYFLQPGGLITTTVDSGQQWDAPNGWAPLQWIAIKGLQHYGEVQLAEEIASRWIALNRKVYENTGKMMEKYNVVDTTLTAGGGEYPTQDGFGWTNGVALGLLVEDARY